MKNCIKSFFLHLSAFAICLFSFATGRAQERPLITIVLGDIEGQWDRLASFVNNTQAFYWDDKGQLKLKPGYRFVFMGDATDKGDSSLRILETLLQLKDDAPERVELMLGNRDVNKLRLPNELSPAALILPPNEEAATQSFQKWLDERKIGNEFYSDAITRLKWILEKTMGAPDAFEHRRSELAKNFKALVGDKQVLESFIADFEPHSGLMSRYLSSAKLAFVDETNKTLFVHGGLNPEAYEFIPGLGQIKGLKNWVESLNSWGQSLIDQGILLKNGSPELVRYQQPIPGTKANQASVIYGRNMNAFANPELIPAELQKKLLEQGIDTIIVGHTPVGEIPVIISNGKFRIVFTDNSASASRDSSVLAVKNQEIIVSAKSPSDAFPQRIQYRHQLGRDSVIGENRPEGLVVGSTQESELLFKINNKNGFKSEYTLRPRSKDSGNLCRELFK